MRFILIDPYNRQAWDLATPYRLTEDFFADRLRCDIPHQVELATGLDLWVSSEPKLRSFRLFVDGPQFTGYGILCGRTKLDEIKSLPRWFNIDMVSDWLVWPDPRTPENSFARRPIVKRHERVNWSAFASTIPSMPLGGVREALS